MPGPTTPARPPVADPSWAHRSARAMGSQVDVLLWATNAEALADWAIAEIARRESVWTRFRPTSELSLLNTQAGKPVAVSESLWDAVAYAAAAFDATDGWYDPTVFGSLMALGYDRTFRAIGEMDQPTDPPSALASRALCFGDVLLDADQRVVTLPHGVGLDLGGIGKGLVGDLVVDGLLARGAVSVCVSVGGDVRVGGIGPHDDGAWNVTVEDPRNDQPAFVFGLVDEAIAQSSVLVRHWMHDGQPVHHLIDPHTGTPSTSDVQCAVVTARQSWLADVLAKAALLAGVDAGLGLLARNDADGWLLDRDGLAHATAAVADVKWVDAAMNEIGVLRC